MKRNSFAILIGALLILSACGQPVPDEKASYVGEWRAQQA
jgi:hypothetical protein